MALGNYISDFTQQVVGTYGFIIFINTESANLIDVDYIQILQVSGTEQSHTDALEAPVTTPVTLATLYGYIASATCPNIAWAKTENGISVFFKSSVYTYGALDTPVWNTPSIILFGKSKLTQLTSITDTIDVEDKYINLFVLYVIKKIYMLKGKTLPTQYDNAIKEELRRLSLANS